MVLIYLGSGTRFRTMIRIATSLSTVPTGDFPLLPCWNSENSCALSARNIPGVTHVKVVVITHRTREKDSNLGKDLFLSQSFGTKKGLGISCLKHMIKKGLKSFD